MADMLPELTPIEHIDPAQYQTSLQGHPPYSSFNYISVRCFWPQAQVILLPDGAALLLDTPFDNQPFLTVLGRNPDLQTLSALARDRQLDATLRLVPECSLPAHATGLDIRERRDSHDYLIALCSMLDPETPGMADKHRLAADCLASNKGLIIEEPSLAQPDSGELVRAIEQAWRSARNGNGNSNCTLTWEREAFRRCLLLAEAGVVELMALVARLADGTPMGFTINELLPDGYYMAHFGKTLPGHPGLAELLELETARRMLQLGCHTMNFQEDHGNPGLRRMKQSWNPCRMLRVYDVHNT